MRWVGCCLAWREAGRDDDDHGDCDGIVVGGGGRPHDQATGHDNQPHVTALAAILGEVSKSMLGLDQVKERRPHSIHLFIINDDGGVCLQVTMPEEGEAGGEGSMLISMAGLQNIRKSLNEVAMRQSQRCLSWYMEDCEVRQWRDRCLENALSDSVSIQALDFALDELAYMCGITNRYISFYSEDERDEDTMNLFISVQELVGCYVIMEDEYCARNVVTAIKIATPTEVQEGVFVSTLVEDALFLLRKCK